MGLLSSYFGLLMGARCSMLDVSGSKNLLYALLLIGKCVANGAGLGYCYGLNQ